MRRNALPVLAPLLFAAVSIAAPTPAAAQRQPLTLAQIMADPDWIGPPVEDYWWSWDGRHAQYTLKREGATIRDTWQVAVDGAPAPALVEDAERAGLDASSPVYDPQRTRMAFIRNGDVFVRDLRSGALQQVTRSNADESLVQWGSDGALSWRVGNDWNICSRK